MSEETGTMFKTVCLVPFDGKKSSYVQWVESFLSFVGEECENILLGTIQAPKASEVLDLATDAHKP